MRALVKVVPVFKYHAIKMNGQMEVLFHAFLALVLNGSEWSPSCLSLYPQYVLDKLCGTKSQSGQLKKRKTLAMAGTEA
jgi:hypothetical protein